MRPGSTELGPVEVLEVSAEGRLEPFLVAFTFIDTLTFEEGLWVLWRGPSQVSFCPTIKLQNYTFVQTRGGGDKQLVSGDFSVGCK